MSHRRVIRRGVAALAVLVGLGWAVWAALTLVDARGSAEAAVDHVESVRSTVDSERDDVVATFTDTGDDDVPAELAEELRAAALDFADAAAGASSPQVAPLRFVPVLGRQIRSVEALSTAASEVAAAAADTVDGLAEIADAPVPDATGRVVAVRSIGEELAVLRGRLDRLDLGPGEALVAPLHEARTTVAQRLEELRSALDRAVPAAEATARLLEGPSRYLLLAANNSEMRAGSGMILQIAPMAVADGRFDVGLFEPTESLLLPEPGAVADPDVEKNWGWLLPTREFRNVNLTPRFEESARMASEMWASSGRGDVDGAIAVDVYALQRLLAAIGPVEVELADGTVVTVDADNVVPMLLRTQYEEFEGDTGRRREQLSRVADAVMEALNSADVAPFDLLQAVWDSVTGRNLMVWSRDADLQEAMAAAGADGVVQDRDLAVGVLNRGGNKLDQFLTSGVAVVGTELSADPDGTGGGTRVELELTLTNEAPEGLPAYVQGPHPNSDQPAGTYEGFASFSLPGAATDVSTDAPLVAFGVDGASRLVATQVVVPRGGTVVVPVSFTLPPGMGAVRVLPSARPRPSQWRAGGTVGPAAFDDAAAVEISVADPTDP